MRFMASVDVRTRTAADVRVVDARDFLEVELPALAADHGELAVAGARELDLRPLAIRVDGNARTLHFDGQQFTVARGEADAHAIVELTEEQLADIVNDLL